MQQHAIYNNYVHFNVFVIFTLIISSTVMYTKWRLMFSIQKKK